MPPPRAKQRSRILYLICIRLYGDAGLEWIPQGELSGESKREGSIGYWVVSNGYCNNSLFNVYVDEQHN